LVSSLVFTRPGWISNVVLLQAELLMVKGGNIWFEKKSEVEAGRAKALISPFE
jgi:hypothetical protein